MKVTEYIKYIREDRERIKSIFNYNKAGLLEQDIQFDENGEQMAKVVNKYDEQQKLIKVTQYQGEDEWINTTETIYQGQEIDQNIIHYPDGSKTFEYYKRSVDTLEIVTKDEDGEFEGSVLRKLSDGITTELIRINFMKKKDSHLKYEYDNSKNLIKLLDLNSRGKVQKIYTFKYDHLGNQVCQDELDRKERLVYRVIHKYEGKLLVSSQAFNQTKQIEYHGKNPIKQTLINPDGSKDISTFAYNQQGQTTEECFYKIPLNEDFNEQFLVYKKRFEYCD